MVPGHVRLRAGRHRPGFRPEQVEVHLGDLGYHLLPLHMGCVRGLLPTVALYLAELTLAALLRVPLQPEPRTVLRIILGGASLVSRIQR